MNSVSNNKLAQRRHRWRLYARGLNSKGLIPLRPRRRPLTTPPPLRRNPRISELERMWREFRATMAQPETI